MKNLKYILTQESIQFGGRFLYRIKALKDFGDVKAGALGGYIEKESNLSQEGNCWVSDDAVVLGNSVVSDYAVVRDTAVVGDYAVVSDYAVVRDYAVISDNAWVSGNALVRNYARVRDNALVSDYAVVLDYAQVRDYAVISDNAWVSGNALVRDNAIATKKVITFRNIYTLTMTDNHIRYGCIQKTIEEWKLFLDSNEVIETKRDTDKFKVVESTLRKAISIWENNKDS